VDLAPGGWFGVVVGQAKGRPQRAGLRQMELDLARGDVVAFQGAPTGQPFGFPAQQGTTRINGVKVS
jgi:hypothetical protein